MAKKQATPQEEKFEKQDFDLFESLLALDKKDYQWYDRLSEEQKKKFVPYMMTHWMSAVKGSKDVQNYYLSSTEYHTNTHLFNEVIQKHPKLQWLMLCAASPGIGRQQHQWIPHLSTKVINFKEPAKSKDVKEYFKKIYPNASERDVAEASETFVKEHKKKCELAKIYPNMNISEIEALSKVVTDEDIIQYQRDSGN